MVSIRIASTSQTSLQFEIYDLGKPANQYNEFYAEIWLDGSRVNYFSYTSSSSGYNTFNSFTGLSPGTYYNIKLWLRSLAGQERLFLGNLYSYTDSPPPPPSAPSWVTATPSTGTGGVAYLEWGYVSAATSYRVRVRSYTSTGTIVQNFISYSLNETIVGLSQYMTYWFEVSAINAYGQSSYTQTSAFMHDLTPPTASITGSSGNGEMSISWSASDSMSGMRSYDRYKMWIGTKDGAESSLVTRNEFTMGSSWIFSSDANNQPFVNGAWYWMGVTAYDEYSNSVRVTKRVQFIQTRPMNWQWTTTKTPGQPVNLGATEWKNFTDRINLFREYKLGPGTASTFTQVQQGNRIRATEINQAISAIRDMNSNVPSVQLGENELYPASVSVLEALRTALNNVA